jgi:hypothetical protein
MKLSDSHVPHTAAEFYSILAAFFVTFALSWPIVFSLDLWVFKDRGSFLNIDYLLARHFRLAVDTYYSYGLLPVLIQHLLFNGFGRGYWPMIACTIVTLILMAGFWARFLRHFPEQKIWLAAVIAISPTLFLVNPNFPYSLVQLSMLFALLFVLEERLDIALAVSAVGCLSVPSLPLALTGLVLLLIVIDWWITSDRSAAYLTRRLAPGACTYVLLALILSFIYGCRSLLATALPILGMKFYKAVNYGGLTALMAFLHPAGRSFKYYFAYYLGTPVSWWVVSTILLFVFGALSIATIFRRRALDSTSSFITVCAILMAVFTFFAYGAPGQEIYYNPVLAAGVLLGLCSLPLGSFRKILLGAFIGLGMFGLASQVHATWTAWTNTRPSTETAGLYADSAWTAEWTDIVHISRKHKLFLLSYGTGEHHYFPTVETADTWFVRTGLLFPADKERLLEKIKDADVVVEDLNGATAFIDGDEDVQDLLVSMCLTDTTANFQIWWRHPLNPEKMVCKMNARRK